MRIAAHAPRGVCARSEVPVPTMSTTKFLLPVAFAAAVGATLYAGVQVVDPEALPEGEGRTILFRACADCHDMATTVLAKRRTPKQWQDVTTDMITRGVQAEEAEITTLVKYLATNVGHVNVNRAPEADLKAYAGFSDAEAKAIVAARAAGKTFATLDDVKAVAGVDAATVDKVKDRIAFNDR